MGNPENKDILIRVAREEDAERIAEIFTYYAEDTAVVLDADALSPAEFAERIRHKLERYPFLVAETDGNVAGYTYASPFIERIGYSWDIETTIYLDRDMRRRGIGRALYTSLENILKEQGVLSMNACITDPETEDEYCTKDSVRFHSKMGYRYVGRFTKSGYKFGRWYDVCWMEKLIGEHPADPPLVKTFGEVRDTVADKYGII